MCAMDYPCIYDVKIPEYRNAEVKATAFLKIAKGIGCGEQATYYYCVLWTSIYRLMVFVIPQMLLK